MLDEVKKQLTESIQQIKENGTLTANEVYDITRNRIVASAQLIKDGTKELHETTKEMITTSVQSLIEAKETSEEKISAALHGVLDAIKLIESEALETAHQEVRLAKKHVQEEKLKLAQRVKESFAGANEAADTFTTDVQENIRTALNDVKLKSTELMGLTNEAVKDAVCKAIETGVDVEETIVSITRDATSQALAEARFTAGQIRRVSENVLTAAVEAAEEMDSHVKETASAATEGVRQGLAESVERIRKSIVSTGQDTKTMAIEEIEQTKAVLESVNDLFVGALHTVAGKTSNATKSLLDEMADDAKKVGSSLREKSLSASHTATERLKELGEEVLDKTEKVSKQAAHVVATEVRELSERMLAIARGAATGMWKGTKEAITKREDNDKL